MWKTSGRPVPHGFSGGGGLCGSPEPSSWNLPICTKVSSVVILGLVQNTCERNFLDNLVRSRRVFVEFLIQEPVLCDMLHPYDS